MLTKLMKKPISLFVRLIVSYLIIISLLVSFNFAIFNIFQRIIINEIIKYNSLTLSNTVDSYESHFTLIQNMMLNQTYKGNVVSLSKTAEINYHIADEIRNEIALTLTNPFLYLENMMILFNEKSLIIQKNNVVDYDDFTAKYYVNKEKGLNDKASIWKRGSNKNQMFQVYPARHFYDIQLGSYQYIGNFMPIVLNNQYEKSISIIALIDTYKLYKAFHQSINNNLVILDEYNSEIFSSGSYQLPDVIYTDQQLNGYEKIDNHYYFYKKGEVSNLTYINIVPLQSITSQIMSMKTGFYLLLILSIFISFIVSIWLSRSVNNPIKQLLETLLNNKGEHLKSNIKEFDIISSRISTILDKHVLVEEDLATKNSLVQNYAYINMLKKIHTDLHDLQELRFVNKSFSLFIFKFKFHQNYIDKSETTVESFSYYIKEYISFILSEYLKDSHTLQIEEDQILSILFNKNEEELNLILNRLQEELILYKEYCYTAIIVSPSGSDSSELTLVYQQALEYYKQRKLFDGIQIIRAMQKIDQKKIEIWTRLEQKEFVTKLCNGNTDMASKMLTGALDHVNDAGVSAEDIYSFIKSLIRAIENELFTLHVLAGEQMSKFKSDIQKCYTLEQVKQLSIQLIEYVAELINQKANTSDYIIDFVTNYTFEYLDENISLEFLAHELKISSSYLSSYFKEKTGINYMDYINNLRIDRAKELLSNNRLQINAISQKLGYTNPNSFIRMFKKYTGLTPGEYRKNSLNN